MIGKNGPTSYNALRFAPEEPVQANPDFQAQRLREAAEILGDLDISPPHFRRSDSESSVDGSNADYKKKMMGVHQLKTLGMSRFRSHHKTLQVFNKPQHHHHSTMISIP